MTALLGGRLNSPGSPGRPGSPGSSDSPSNPDSLAPILACTDIVYRRGTQTVLDRIGLRIQAGEIVSLLGANGAGKSTLLRILLGVLRPDSGTVTLHGRDLAQYKRRDIAHHLAYVPQQHVPAFPYTVEQIVLLGRLPHAGLNGLGLHFRASSADLDAVHTAMTQLQVATFASRFYTELSGGERQRVLIARALAQGASMLILDEPITGLDFGHQMRLLSLLEALADAGHTILTSTHRPEQALLGSSRAVLLNSGQVVADGPPRDVITSTSMSELYGVAMHQIDQGPHRFFIPASVNTGDSDYESADDPGT